MTVSWTYQAECAAFAMPTSAAFVYADLLLSGRIDMDYSPSHVRDALLRVQTCQDQGTIRVQYHLAEYSTIYILLHLVQQAVTYICPRSATLKVTGLLSKSLTTAAFPIGPLCLAITAPDQLKWS